MRCPVAAADRVYFTSREGNTVVIKHGAFEKAENTAAEKTPGKPVIIATNKLDDRFDASAAIVDDEIILRKEGKKK